MAASMKHVRSSDEPTDSIKLSRNVDKNLLDAFWDLSKTKQPLRFHAAISIIQILHKKQKDLIESGTKDAMSPELEYTLERLVRGLASPRLAARQGFCLVLTEILKAFPVVQAEDIVKHVEANLSSHNKLEKCQIVIGRLMAFTAIIRSKRLKNDLYLSYIITNLYGLSVGKSYIQQAVYKLMIDLFSQLDIENFKESVWPHLKKELSCGWEKCTPDGLWYLLLSLRIFPGAISSKFLIKHWGSEDLCSAENLSHWQNIIKQSTTVHPQLHPVCSEFLELTIKKKILHEVWNVIVDDNLFDSNQNEKSYLGFLMVKEVLNKTRKKRIVKSILSPKLCAVLAKSYLNVRHTLHPAANELVSFLSGIVKDCSDSQVQVAILKPFLLQPRAALMEQILKKKEIVLMISYLTSEGVHAFYNILKDIVFSEVENSETEESVEDHRRHQAVLQIGMLVSHQAMLTDTEWRMRVIEFLFLHAFFTVTGPVDELNECDVITKEFPSSLRKAFANSFTKALDSFNRRIETPLPPLQQLLQFLLSIVNYADSLLQINNSSLSPLFPVEKVISSWTSMKSVVQKLSKQSKKDGKLSESNAFQILFLQLGLQLFQDQEHIPGILEELEICCKKALKVRKQKGEMESEEDEEPPWIQVVVDILLSLLSQPSHHMRCIVSSVFPLVCPFVTSNALQLILDVINPEKEVEENPLVNEDTDGENDVEFESGSSSDEAEKSSDEEENADKNVDEQFKSKLQEALGSSAVDVSDAESEVMLTDSEMFKLDDALSEAFRSRKKLGHSKLTSEQKTLMHFRIRCMDLISVFLKAEPPMYIVVQIIKPFLAASELGSQHHHHDALSKRALSILKQIAKIRKFQNCEKVDTDTLCDIIDALFAKAHKETNNVIGSVLYSLCVFMVLCERKLKTSRKNVEEEDVKSAQLEMSKKYLTALNDFVKQNNSHVIPEMFVTLMNACPEHAWSYLEPLQDYAFDEGVRLYRRSQCLGLILSAIKFSKGQKFITTDMWLQLLRSLASRTIKALAAVINSTDIKPMYTTELLSILSTIATISKEKNLSVLQQHSALLPLLTSMTIAQCKRITRKGNTFRKQLILALGGELPSKQKTQKKDTSVTNVHQNEVTNSTEDNKQTGNGVTESSVSSDDSEG